MPSVATLFNHWKDFREREDYVREASGAPDETYELTAVSECQEGGPVLLRIPGASGETFFVEYRLDSKWDRGLPYPVVVIHSFGAHGRDVWPLDWGADRVWFEYEIPEPFFDTWASSPALGVEVVRQSHDKKKNTIRVTRPSKCKKVELLDLPINRFVIGRADVDSAILSLNRDNDLLICDSELKDYKVIIQTFEEHGNALTR